MIADDLAPNRCQAISSHHADFTSTLYSETSNFAWHKYHATAIEQTMFRREREVSNPLVSFLLAGLPSHTHNAQWYAATTSLSSSVMLPSNLTWKIQMNAQLWLTHWGLNNKRNGYHFADNIFKCIFLNDTFVPVPEGPSQSALVQIMIWCLEATSHYLRGCWSRCMG